MNKITKEFVENILKEYGEQNDDNIDLSGIDFGHSNLNLTLIKAKNIDNSKQVAVHIDNSEQGAGSIYNYEQDATNIYNHEQNATNVDNSEQKAVEIINSEQNAVEINNYYQQAMNINNYGQEATVIFNYYQDAEEITNHGQEATTIDNCGQRIYDKIYFNIGEYNRTIYVNHVKDFKFDIGCFEGTAEELRKSSIEKYGTENNPYLEIIEDYETNVKEKK